MMSATLRMRMALFVAVLMGAAVGTRPAAAQVPAAAPPPRAPGIAVTTRTGSTLVAITLVIPSGSADDPDSIPGAARLVGETIAQAVRWRLDPDAAQLELRVERGWTAFTLLATPDVWVRSWAVLEDVAFRISLADAPLEAARKVMLDEFTFETGAPVREFDREMYYVLGGARSPWSRDPRGTQASVRRASSASLERFREGRYRMAQSVAAVVGPVSEPEARAALAPIGAGPLDPPTSNGPAWERGERVPLQRDVTNTWIGAAFPAPRDLSRTQLEFVGYQIQEALTPSPPDPGVFSVLVRVENTPPGPVLVVEAAVMPEVTEAWEKRILGAVERLGERVDETFFRWQRRRFRSWVLLREGQPEEAALRMALDLAREGRVRPLQEELWAIGTTELAKATDELETPRVLVLGPDLSAR